MVCDPPVTYAHNVDAFEVDLAVSWSDAKESPFMRPVICLISRHVFTIGKLPVDFRMEVRESYTNRTVELPDTLLVRSHIRLRCMVNEIIGKAGFKFFL
jgi:hypothetical protein